MDSIEEKFDYKKNINNIDYDKLYGLGGSFLVSPVEKSKTFSKEMFSEDQKCLQMLLMIMQLAD